MVQHAFSMVLYGMTGYTLMSAIVAGLWGMRALRFRQAEVRANGLEPIIRGWLNDSDLSTKPASNPTWNFGFLTTLPNGESIHIMQMKEHTCFITFQANLAISTEHPEHQAIQSYVNSIFREISARDSPRDLSG